MWVQTFRAETTKEQTASSRPVLSNYLEDWEDPSKLPLSELRKRTTEFLVQQKYNPAAYDVCIFDEGEDDGAPYSEHRKITGVVWENRSGWKVLTELVGVPGETKEQSYMVNAAVNATLYPLIAAGKNSHLELRPAPEAGV